MGWSEIFAALTDKKDLSNDQVTWGMSQILDGVSSNEDIKAFLTGYRHHGGCSGFERTTCQNLILP